MKRIGFFLVLMTMVFPRAYTQVTLGVKGGLNISTITDWEMTSFTDKDKLTFDYGHLAGLHLGGYAFYNISSKFGLQGELLYSQMGYKPEIPNMDYGGKQIGNVTGTVRLHYLQMPVLLKFTVYGTGVFLEVGPQAGLLLGEKLSLSGTYPDKYEVGFSNNQRMSVSTFDLSAVAGLGYRMSNGFALSARYIYGFKTSDDNFIPGISQNRAFQISLAYDIKTF